jgi:hypothetical protein
MPDANLPPTQIYKFPDGTEVKFRAVNLREEPSIREALQARDPYLKKSVARLIGSAVIEPRDASLLLRDLRKLERITADDLRDLAVAILKFSSEVAGRTFRS